MSKRQEKIEARKAEQMAFLYFRQVQQLKAFEDFFQQGLKFYEENKSKLSEKEIEEVEEEIQKNHDLIKTMKEALGLEDAPRS